MTLNISMPGTIGGAGIVFPLERMKNIGIVGVGYVGGAIRDAIENKYNSSPILVDPGKGYKNTIADLKDTEGVFVCVPTPQGNDGTCDIRILEDVLSSLNEIDYAGVIISKCTAPPDVYERLNNQFPNLVHAPEFLTAVNATQDYINGRFAIIGGRINAYRREAERIIRMTQVHLGENVRHCSIGEASLAKYTINSFLATKVTFMNEIYGLATAFELDYNTIANMVKLDSRIGNSHMQVPGPDGQFGFGGACFPKDTSALIKFAEQKNVSMNVLESAVKKNLLLRLTEPK